jgi:hypothetical protein
LAATEEKVEKGLISSALKIRSIRLNEEAEPFNLAILEGGNSSADVIPYFNHPLLISNGLKDAHGQPIKEFAVDARNFGKWYAPNQEFIIRNHVEYNWSIKRALLNQIWITGRPDSLRDLSTIPAAVYSSLISECVARRFALDANEQAIIAVLSCFFYYGLFTESKTLDEFSINKIGGKIASVTRVPATKVFEIIEGMDVLKNLEELCVACQEKTGSISLNEFSIGVLIAICSGTWFGMNARENLSVGLEHPPTWIMIVAASLSETGFKRSVLAKISLRYDKSSAGDDFLKSLSMMLGGNKLIDTQVTIAA